MSSLTARALQGGAWMGLGMATQKALGVVSFLVLARLLTPADFGVIALGLTLVGTVESLTTPGFERAVLQRPGKGLEFLDPIWTINVLKGGALFALLWALAPRLAAYFGAADSAPILRLLSALFLVQGVTNVAQLYFFKDLDFRRVYLRDLAGQLAYLAVALPWALSAPSAWALAWGQMARCAVSAASTYVLHPYRPGLCLDFARLRELRWFGAWAMAQTAWGYVSSVLDNLFVAHWLGAESLGFYSKGRDLAWLPLSPVANIIGKVSLPAYARAQKEPAKVREGLLRAAHAALLLALPAAALFLAQADGLVSVLLGERWLPMAGPLKALTLAMLARSLVEVSLPALEALGRPDLRLAAEFIQGASTLILLYPAIARWGAAGAGWAVAAGAALALAFTLRAVGRVAPVRAHELAAPALVPALCSLPVAFSGAWLAPGGLHPALYMGAIAGLGGLYLALLVLFGRLDAGPVPALKGAWRAWSEA